ncbi:hypothetical protein KSD_02070 [Ktedonobacter sp. SOSP1-85]|uniref:hypothetical protein n=1 Tax=Ktedonobacter sp. SOSP1-85 TaxID=2778367 RepID=UPI001915A4EC|nr:hypothetical protein [Ktedonobacter sp. SOSP1-85]GHO72436.1 hypothetical protein KSD_02070 [Ktedonobacter sp. SOSP1-85]
MVKNTLAQEVKIRPAIHLPLTPLEEENRQLKREVERLRQERDIVKKAISIFSHVPA